MSALAERTVGVVAAQADRRVAKEEAAAELKASIVNADPYASVRPQPHPLTNGLPPPPGWPKPAASARLDGGDAPAPAPARVPLDVFVTHYHRTGSKPEGEPMNRYVLPDGARVAAKSGAAESEVVVESEADAGAAAVAAVEADAAANAAAAAAEVPPPPEVPGLYGFHADRYRQDRAKMETEWRRRSALPPPQPPAGVALMKGGREHLVRAL